MKKNNKILITSCLLLTALSSCKSTYVGGHSAIPNVTINYNLTNELLIDTTKVLQSTSTTNIFLGFIKFGDNKFSDAFYGGTGDREKSAATYKALEGTQFDIIINPKYLVEIKRGLFHQRIKATVAGYGAKIKIKLK
jgi:hypothetical protein